MGVFIDTLRDRYSMSDTSFTEVEYRERLGRLLEHTPNLAAVRLNLPFQLISRHCRAATMILGNTIEALAHRLLDEDAAPLRTLVVENLTDATIVRLWHNPLDVKNIIDVFAELEHLVLSVRRHEDELSHTATFHTRLWEMIEKAPELRSLCLVGLNIDEKQLSTSSSSASSSSPASQSREPRTALIKTSTHNDIGFGAWQSRTLPGFQNPSETILPYLAHLELRRVEVSASVLLSVFECFEASLRELYLDHVYLKTVDVMTMGQQNTTRLWVGLPNVTPGPDHDWIAVCIRQLHLRLRVCRATNLGYDQYIFAAGASTAVTTTEQDYDLQDPCGLGRTLEQRFVEVALGYHQPPAPDGSPVEYLPEEPALQQWALADREAVSVAEALPQSLTSSNNNGGSNSNISSTPVKEHNKGKARADETNGVVVREANSTSAHVQSPTCVSSPGQRQRDQWWSAERHLEGRPHPRNPTSGWTRHSIDGRFANCNPFTLHELQHVADTALEGMSLVQMIDFNEDQTQDQNQNQNQASGSNNLGGGGADGNGGQVVAREDEDENEDEHGDGDDEDDLAGLRSVMFTAGVTDDGEDASGS